MNPTEQMIELWFDNPSIPNSLPFGQYCQQFIDDGWFLYQTIRIGADEVYIVFNKY